MAAEATSLGYTDCPRLAPLAIQPSPPMWVILASLPKGEMQSREASSLYLGQGTRGGARVSGLRSFALSTLPVRGFPASMQELL